jgi:hypothetical protein
VANIHPPNSLLFGDAGVGFTNCCGEDCWGYRLEETAEPDSSRELYHPTMLYSNISILSPINRHYVE